MPGEIRSDIARSTSRYRIDGPSAVPSGDMEAELRQRCEALEARLESTQRHFESFVEAVSREREGWSRQREALAATAAELESRLAGARDQQEADRRRLVELTAEARRRLTLIRAEAGFRHLLMDQLVQSRLEAGFRRVLTVQVVEPPKEFKPRRCLCTLGRLRKHQMWRYAARTRRVFRRLQATFGRR